MIIVCHSCYETNGGGRRNASRICCGVRRKQPSFYPSIATERLQDLCNYMTVYL